MNFFQRSAVLLKGMCWLTATQPGLPASMLRRHGIALNTITITLLQTLCQDTVVTQPSASVPHLSTRLMGAERRREEEKKAR